jgi:hypothetical protein
MPLYSYTVTLLGENPLLIDRDNLTFVEEVKAWQHDPGNRDKQKPGDDRSPAWAWLGKVYYEDTSPLQQVSIPVGMLQACIRDAATMIRHPTGKANKTLKDVSQSGILIAEAFIPLLVPGEDTWRPISYKALYERLRGEDDFRVHEGLVKEHGFQLSVLAAKPPGQRARHVRVRPLFPTWQAVCHVTVTDDVLTEPILRQIFEYAGRYKGLGNWRPSTIRPGSYGTFQTDVVEGEVELVERKSPSMASRRRVGVA